ncbi:MAG: sigma-70 family RNA polymerase sigma factor [Deltaproteobacteria bacterium]|nr:sigma-70 family RNA polymerase sigma factor [Deltaproteobacteria bacterium]
MDFDINKLHIQCLKVAKSLLKKWNSTIEQEEIDGIVNLSLAEALNKFDPTKGTSIITFLYYHLKGNLIKHIEATVKNKEVPIEEAGIDFYNSKLVDEHCVIDTQLVYDPEKNLDRKQIMERFYEALENLSDLERKVLTLNLEEGMKVQHIAKKLNLSRSYLSRLKHQALKRVCLHLARTANLKELHFGKIFDIGEERRRKDKPRRMKQKRFKQKFAKVA